MMFRGQDLLAEFERLTKGLNFGPEFEEAMDDLSSAFSDVFGGERFSKGWAEPTSGPVANDAVEVFRTARLGGFGGSVDAVRSAERFELFIDLPGVDPAKVDLTVEGRTITVSADRTFTVADGADHVHRGRRHGMFHRSFKLGEDLDLDALTARSEHGVLVISVPVAESSQSRKVSISTEPASIDATANVEEE